MEMRNLIKYLMRENDLSNVVIAERIGLTAQAFWDRVNNRKHKSIGVDTALEILQAMDYRLVVVPVGSRLPAGSYEVSGMSEPVYKKGDAK